MKPLLSTLKSLTGFVTKYIGVIIIAFTIWACVTPSMFSWTGKLYVGLLGRRHVRHGALY